MGCTVRSAFEPHLRPQQSFKPRRAFVAFGAVGDTLSDTLDRPAIVRHFCDWLGRTPMTVSALDAVTPSS